jgi:hypothetical protein
MPSRTIRTEADREAFTRLFAAFPLPCTASLAKGIRRSDQQSRTVEKWYAQIGQETSQLPIQAKAECKLRYGLPIMLTENPAWVQKWAPLYEPFDYARRLTLFEVIPMTSLFTTRQMSAYMDAVQGVYRAMGIALIDPEARRYEAEMGPRA